MADNRNVLPDPLVFIGRCVRERKIFWTYHVQMRLKGRVISRESLLRAVGTYEIVESYPEDKYLPSYLVLCHSDEGAAHVQIATDVEGDNIRVVTVYRPSPREWESDLRTRRKNP